MLLTLLVAAPLVAERPKDVEPSRLRRADESVRQFLFGRAVVREAGRHIGQPYAWGDKEGKEGFDCSGLTKAVFGSFGIELAPNAVGQIQKGIGIERPALQAGDLVFFASGSPDTPMHVGIYAGEDQFIHAPGTGELIRRENFSKSRLANRYLGARRYLPEPRPVTKPSPSSTPTKETRP